MKNEIKVNKEDKEIIKILEKKGFIIEQQPKFKITSENDEDFLMMHNNIFEFYKEVIN